MFAADWIYTTSTGFIAWTTHSPYVSVTAQQTEHLQPFAEAQGALTKGRHQLNDTSSRLNNIELRSDPC